MNITSASVGLAPAEVLVVAMRDIEAAIARARNLYRDAVANHRPLTSDVAAIEIYPDLQRILAADPKLRRNIRGQFRREVSDIPSFRECYFSSDGRKTLALLMDHHWALWTWSRYFLGLPKDVPIELFHFDDHEDLSEPSLDYFKDAGCWVDPVLQRPVDLTNPMEVELLIKRRLIGIGSFISPFISLRPTTRMYHITANESGARQIGLRARNGETIGAVYVNVIGLSDLGNRITIAKKGVTLVDIDFDVFANLERQDEESLSVNRREVARTIDTTLDWVISAVSGADRAVVSLALSPGFFPSEYWDLALGFRDQIVTAFGLEKEAGCAMTSK